MSEPATKKDAILLVIVIVLTNLLWGIAGHMQAAKTRRCIVESRNSVEVPEVCK